MVNSNLKKSGQLFIKKVNSFFNLEDYYRFCLYSIYLKQNGKNVISVKDFINYVSDILEEDINTFLSYANDKEINVGIWYFESLRDFYDDGYNKIYNGGTFKECLDKLIALFIEKLKQFNCDVLNIGYKRQWDWLAEKYNKMARSKIFLDSENILDFESYINNNLELGLQTLKSNPMFNNIGDILNTKFTIEGEKIDESASYFFDDLDCYIQDPKAEERYLNEELDEMSDYKADKVTYHELFSLLKDSNNNPHRFYLWHMSNVDNVINMMKCGKLLARESKIDHKIPWNTMAHNDVTKIVMDSNASYLLPHYVRLYLNPINDCFYSFRIHDSELVLISFDFNVITRSENPVILHMGNAHDATKDDLSWKSNAINRQPRSKRLNIPNFNEENIKLMYQMYDKDLSKEDKNLMKSEVLVYDSLDISFIRKIYFEDAQLANKFLSAIQHYECYNIIKEKVEVNPRVFKGSIYDYRK